MERKKRIVWKEDIMNKAFRRLKKVEEKAKGKSWRKEKSVKDNTKGKRGKSSGRNIAVRRGKDTISAKGNV